MEVNQEYLDKDKIIQCFVALSQGDPQKRDQVSQKISGQALDFLAHGEQHPQFILLLFDLYDGAQDTNVKLSCLIYIYEIMAHQVRGVGRGKRRKFKQSKKFFLIFF